ncbi:hypothetical protein [Thalassotalea crassostreae]|uniref:hypothetical protein n=1 Tax=Thalassotalea crassostreae TaxID=1763536 RepID=UPI0008382880|nr:hypothetical protein [Thalassotalea crassostreae]
MSDLYKQLFASDSEFFNKCYYCSDDSNYHDFIPPEKYSNRFIRNKSADYIKVPICSECKTYLKGNRSPYFSEHVEIVKKGIKKKYSKALSIYELWGEKEVDDLDEPLSKSILAGIKLGKEAYERYKFKGFQYEIDGNIVRPEPEESIKLSIFGEIFDSYKDALDYASDTYQISKALLRDLLKEYNDDFELAIRKYQSDMVGILEEFKLKKLCKEFGEEHDLSFELVYKKLTLERKYGKSKSIPQLLSIVLEKIHAEYRDFIFFIIRKGLNTAKKYVLEYKKNRDEFRLDDFPKKPSEVYKRSWKEINADYFYYKELNADNDYILDSINYISYEMIKNKKKIAKGDLELFLESNDVTTTSEYKTFLEEISEYDAAVCFPTTANEFLIVDVAIPKPKPKPKPKSNPRPAFIPSNNPSYNKFLKFIKSNYIDSPGFYKIYYQMNIEKAKENGLPEFPEIEFKKTWKQINLDSTRMI